MTGSQQGYSSDVLVSLQVREHAWGTDTSSVGPQADVIIGADVIYQAEHFEALIASLWALCAQHTLIFLSFRVRGSSRSCAAD